LPDISQLRLDLHCADPPECSRLADWWPFATSKIRAAPSRDAVASRVPSVLNATIWM